MGLTCSLLGHTRGDPETEREREERGDEVVVVTREVRECMRCGDRSVVSENTEVRPAREPAADTPAETSEAEPVADAEAEPAGDDGVILEDDGERAPGEWPSAEDTRAEAASGPAAGAGEGGAVVETEADVDADAETAAGTESETGGGAAEFVDPDPGETAEPVADVTGREWPDEGRADEPTPEGVGTGIAAADPVGAADAGSGDAVFVCPSCEFREPSAGSSHREGDICPECRQGYLAERTRN